MKAVYIQQHGPVDDVKVSEIPVPSLRSGEVLVKIEAAGINPSDVGSIVGRFPDSVLPRVVGRDFSGTVVEGPAELVGAEVWGTGGDLGVSRDGTHAEYIALPREAIARRPGNLKPEEAAAVGVPFITAFSAAVQLGGLKRGGWLIVAGAAGAVGQAAIQIANAEGASVIALVRDAGQRWVGGMPSVHAVAQSDQANLEAVVRDATQGKGADVALNGIGASVFAPLQASLGLGGRQVVYSVVGGKDAPIDLLAFYKNQSALLGLDTQKFDAARCAGILNGLAPLFESGALQPPKVAQLYPLSRAPEAYRRVAAGSMGKVVLVMGS